MFSLICALNKRLSKQSRGWWFGTPLWRHSNVFIVLAFLQATPWCHWALQYYQNHGWHFIHYFNFKNAFCLEQTQQHLRLQDTLQWRHNGCDGVSNHQCLDCLLRCRSTKASKLRITGLCGGDSPMTGEFPSQRTSNAENVSIWWRHHDNRGSTVPRSQRYMSLRELICSSAWYYNDVTMGVIAS